MTQGAARDLVARRDALRDRIVMLATSDDRIRAAWLQGSLARGDHDLYSDVDAYFAIEDGAFDSVWNDRASLLAQLGRPLAWSDATTPGFRAIHALLDGGVRLDLAFERASQIEQQKRPAVLVLFDRGGCASRLRTGWAAPGAAIGQIVVTIIRMTRQGATWPLRLLGRGQWSTLAMMELDLINQQVAQLMAIRREPANFYANPFSLFRALDADQRGEIDRLTQRALAAAGARDASALKDVHLDVYDALVREGRAACAALGAPYPIGEQEDAAIRALLEREWPG
jgi:predicted nucleotidyltransferase